VPAKITVEAEGVEETIAAVRGIAKDLRKEANAEIRVAAKRAAGELVVALQAAASSAATPVSRRVAASVRVKSDRFPTVAIGGSKRVGRRGAPAAVLVWGSEQGGRNFAAGAGGSYWIAPTVERFASSGAIPIFEDAIGAIVRRYRMAGV
jgi:hypothetical protein